MHRLLPAQADDVAVEDAYAVDATTYLRANMVTSADGAATFHGRVGPLTGPPDQRVLLGLRALADVVVVGAGTVRAEGYGGPLIPESWRRWRVASGRAEHPRLAIVTARLDLDLGAPPFTDAPTRPLLLVPAGCPGERCDAARPVADVAVAGAGTVDPAEALRVLAALGLGRVLCEGGPRLLTQFLARRLVDELCLTVAPTVVSGDGRRLTDGPGLAPPAGLELAQVLEDESYLFLRYRPRG
ncbi:MAG TPA: pyrimidine reductase family protein [Streptosporangiales bacterium]